MKKEKKLVAYLIQAHHQADHLAALISVLNTDPQEVSFFIHIDKKAQQESFESRVGHLDNVFFVKNRVSVSWGGYSQVEATLRLIELALEPNNNFKYFKLLSGVDYPIKSNKDILCFFRENSRNYIDVRKIEGKYKKFPALRYYILKKCGLCPPNDWGAFEKYSYHLYPHIINSGPNTKAGKKIVVVMLFFFQCLINIILPRKKIPENIHTFYHGSAWWALNFKTVSHIYNYIITHKNIVNFYKFSKCSDEIIFQTVLMNTVNSPDYESAQLTYTKWGKERILIEEDFEVLKACDSLFARKFDYEQSKSLRQKIDRDLSIKKY